MEDRELLRNQAMRLVSGFRWVDDDLSCLWLSKTGGLGVQLISSSSWDHDNGPVCLYLKIMASNSSGWPFGVELPFAVAVEVSLEVRRN